MNQKELVEAVYGSLRENEGVTREQVNKIVSQTFKEIKTGILRDKEVKIKEFGTFSVRRKRGREVNNDLVSGVKVPAHNVVYFRVAEKIKKEIW